MKLTVNNLEEQNAALFAKYNKIPLQITDEEGNNIPNPNLLDDVTTFVDEWIKGSIKRQIELDAREEAQKSIESAKEAVDEKDLAITIE